MDGSFKGAAEKEDSLVLSGTDPNDIGIQKGEGFTEFQLATP